jgi:hypothetical protein
MSNLFLWFKQAGEGCDYTIGCGEILLELKATNMEDAKKEALKEAQDRGFQNAYDKELECAVILEFKENIFFHLTGEMEKINESEEEVERQKKIEDLEKELRKLKNVHGG